MQVFGFAKNLTKSLAEFALGEVAARLSTLALYAFITRRFGVAVFGYVALAQIVSSYVTLFADQGYKLIGARVVARNHELAPYLIRLIAPRRAIIATVSSLGGLAYAFWGPVPPNSRMLIASFVLAVIPASLALDWVLWGTRSYMKLSLWKCQVSVISSGVAIGGMLLIGRPLLSIAVGNILGALTGAVSLWLYFARRLRSSTSNFGEAELSAIRGELKSTKVFSLGIANLLNLVFTNSDMLLLAAMTNPTEIGNYGSATRLMFVIFSAYYLLLNTLYPMVARITDIKKLKSYLLPSMGILLAVGLLSTLLLSFFARQALTLVYGTNQHADNLLRVLAWAFPFELGVSLIGTVLASQGYEKVMLRCLFLASGLNVVLNLIFIPRFQALASAWSTVASYSVLWICYLGCVIMLRPKANAPAAIVEA